MLNKAPGTARIAFDILRAPLYVSMIGYGSLKAVGSLRKDAPFTRLQAALRFLGWFLLFPVVVNVLRLLGW
jgi:hypothetical protein